MKIGFCIECKKFYEDIGGAFGQCPSGHSLLHETKCNRCDTKLYFQTDDDYCGPENPIICEKCANILIKEDK